MSNHKKGGIYHDRYLTSREIECASWAVERLTNKQIAEKMQVSPRTAEAHIENLKKKLGCYSKVQLVALLEPYFLTEKETV